MIAARLRRHRAGPGRSRRACPAHRAAARALERLQAVEMPVFAANGDSNQMILSHNTYRLAGLIPQARVKIHPDSGHGFLFQHHAGFAADVDAFLRR